MVIEHPLVSTILNRKCIRQMFTYMDVSFIHILVGLSSFTGTPAPNSIRMTYNTSLSSKSWASLKH
jgi:hypothetical protein